MTRLKSDQAEEGASKTLRVVIVGAGFGGLAVVDGLRRLPVEMTIIDRQNHHLFQPLLYQVATAALSPADIAGPIRAIVKKARNVHVVLDEVVGIDADDRRVRLASGAAYPYDRLVIATGARHSYFGNDQWSAVAPGVKTIDDATLVRRRILLAMERAETYRQERTSRREEHLTFVIIGGGPTGVEMAGAVAELTRHAAAMDFRYITPRCVKIVLIEAGDRLLPGFPKPLSDFAKTELEKLGVDVLLGRRVTDIDEMGVSMGAQRIVSSTVIWAAGVQASPAAGWLGAASDRAGRVLVEPDLTLKDHPDIFVIGDTASVIQRDGTPVPGIAPAAKQQGVYVAKRIAAALRGGRVNKAFRYRNFGTLATIGRKSAVINFGWIQVRGQLAWLIWSTAHLYFLVGFRNRLLVGLTWLWNYLTFERGARLITGLPSDHE